MKTFARQWDSTLGWDSPIALSTLGKPQLILAFWNSKSDPELPLNELASRFPQAVVVGCSTAGGIHGADVTDVDLVATGVEFADARVRCSAVEIPSPLHSREAGRQLGYDLLGSDPEPDFVLVISDGLVVNGSDLTAGLREAIRAAPISGGLAGDGPDFSQTQVSLDATVMKNSVVAVGVWGAQIEVNHGSAGGWEPFGPSRVITKSAGSTLYELDNRPALHLYRTYLGEEEAGLPGTALRFPLAIKDPEGTQHLVRTVLAIDTEENSLRFAGDIPSGWSAQLMRTSFDRLIDGAQVAARTSLIPAQRGSEEPLLAIAVSCIGRRLVLGQRTSEEVEACLDILGESTTLSGFYAYGEIAPVDGLIGLHNQTMTLTTVAEVGPPTDEIKSLSTGSP